MQGMVVASLRRGHLQWSVGSKAVSPAYHSMITAQHCHAPVKAARVALVGGVEAIRRAQQHVERRVGCRLFARQRGSQRACSALGGVCLLG